MRRLCRGLRLPSAASPLALLRQRVMMSCKSVPSVTILRLMTRSKSSTIAPKSSVIPSHPSQSTCHSQKAKQGTNPKTLKRNKQKNNKNTK